MYHLTATVNKPYRILFFLAVIILFFSSCTVVKNYPVRQPFVYKTNIEIEGQFSADQKKELENQLNQQLHDSVRVREVSKLFYSLLNKPPVFDSLNADKSIQFMSALLHSLGYYRDTLSFDTSINYRGDEYRTTIDFNVKPGKLVHIDSIWYNMGDSTLQKITEEARKESVIKKGEPFAKPLISTELSRLVDIYRNNGYLLFGFDDLLAVWDTVGLALLRPTLDPIEQAEQLRELQRRRANPIADIEVRLRTREDSMHLTRYYVGNVTIYPDLASDTALYQAKESIVDRYRIVSYFNYVKPIVLLENIYLHRGELYDQRNYLKTLNRFNSLTSWRVATIDQAPRQGTDTVDFVIRLTPAKKYAFDVNLEGSKNFNTIYFSNLIGIGVNVGLQNRNFAHAANQSSTNVRYGVELSTSGDVIQTQQISFGHNIYFPRFVPRLKVTPPFVKDKNIKTVFGFRVENTDRKQLFNISSFSTSWGYELSWSKNQINTINKLLAIRLPNVEYSVLTRRSLLDKLIDTNASYKYIFNNGLITSTIINYTVSYPRKRKTSQVRLNGEGSGLMLGFLRTKFLDTTLYRFLKLDAEYRQNFILVPNRREFAWRIFVGSGVGLPRFRGDGTSSNPADSLNYYLPFFRQYYGGGPNSMRAWALRKLGPGSTVRSFDRTIAPDRFADVQIEANAEYRFFLTEISGVRLNSALFTDMGNIWFLRENKDFPDGEFRFSKLWKDLAIGVGTGLRVDFGFLNIRLDYAYKAKDPSPDIKDAAGQNKWFYNWKPGGGRFQLGVNYPF
jgi:outer membrane protein insertion porin family